MDRGTDGGGTDGPMDRQTLQQTYLDASKNCHIWRFIEVKIKFGTKYDASCQEEEEEEEEDKEEEKEEDNALLTPKEPWIQEEF